MADVLLSKEDSVPCFPYEAARGELEVKEASGVSVEGASASASAARGPAVFFSVGLGGMGNALAMTLRSRLLLNGVPAETAALACESNAEGDSNVALSLLPGVGCGNAEREDDWV